MHLESIYKSEKASGAGNSFGELMSPIEEARYYQYLGRKAPQVRIPNSSYYHYREYNETIEK